MPISRLALALVLCLAASACNRIDASPVAPAAQDPASAARAVDTAVADDLVAGGVADARSWLRRDSNRLFQGDPYEVQRFVDDLYAEGAPQVWFTGIERFERVSVSTTLAVELPRDMVKRSAVLRLAARFRGEAETAPDLGQRYLQFAIE